VFMNVTLSIDEQTVERARKRAESLGKSLNQVIRLQKLAGRDDRERSIENSGAASRLSRPIVRAFFRKAVKSMGFRS
jgi:hypothetical protein